MSQLVNEIKARLSESVKDESKWTEFHQYLALVVCDVHRTNDSDAEALCDEIEWAFLDLKRGASREDVRRNLLRLAAPERNPVFFGQAIVVGTSYTVVGSNTSSSARLLTTASVASMGRPSVSRETVPA
jgi:hypothetical protein